MVFFRDKHRLKGGGGGKKKTKGSQFKGEKGGSTVKGRKKREGKEPIGRGENQRRE